MEQIINSNTDNGLFVYKFGTIDIPFYGTYINPLFKANDIGELLGIERIRNSIKDFDKDELINMAITDSLGRLRETNMLTEQGLYRFLMTSRKPIAKEFQKWVFEVIKEIRLTGTYKLEQQLSLTQKENDELKKELEKRKHTQETAGIIYIALNQKEVQRQLYKEFLLPNLSFLLPKPYKELVI
jgi:prophage antirepressor-like protein